MIRLSENSKDPGRDIQGKVKVRIFTPGQGKRHRLAQSQTPVEGTALAPRITEPPKTVPIQSPRGQTAASTPSPPPSEPQKAFLKAKKEVGVTPTCQCIHYYYSVVFTEKNC